MSIVDLLTERAAGLIEARTSRRGFVGRSAMVGSALMVGGSTFALRPGTAYAAICSCPPSGDIRRSCGCGELCCGGYTEFCCHIYGQNACPPDTLLAGWWKVDNSRFCDGDARYYMDCNSAAPGCACGSRGVCKDATPCQCRTCDSRRDGCTVFRYGNCNNDVSCVGPILCRVVTCSKPWELDPGCSTVPRVDNNTRYHHRPCLEEPVEVEPVEIADGDRAWANAIYADYLGRPPTQGEEDELAEQASRGQSRTELSKTFSTSDAYVGEVVDRLFNDILGRLPADSGRQFWVAKLQDGANINSVAASLYGSPEFFRRAGGVDAYVTAVFQGILGRDPSPSGLAYWSATAADPAGRRQMGAWFLDSAESRRERVARLYLRFLDRLPNSAGLEHWASILLTDDDLTLATFLSGGPEYYDRASERFS